MLMIIASGLLIAVCGGALGYIIGYGRGFDEAKTICDAYPPLSPKSWQDAYRDEYRG